ncbi:MAG: ribonuclease HI [Mariprofundaceae bacterium]
MSPSPKELPEVHAFTDGACSGNPGPGGWGVLLRMGKHEKEFFGGEADTTNQQMELQAAVEALKALNKPCNITIHSDSKYVVQGMSEWIHNWKVKGWKTAGKKPVSNLERWKELDALSAKHQVNWQWIKGHAGHPENERADELARRGVPQAQ